MKVSRTYIFISRSLKRHPKRSIKRYLYTNFTPLPDKKEK